MKKLTLLIVLLFALIGCEAQQGNFFWSYAGNVNPYFIFTVHTTAANTSMTLPLASGNAYDFVVDWGDGTIGTVTTYNDADATHIYADAGDYTIKMIGVCNRFGVADGAIKTYITSVVNWGNMDFRALNFDGCLNLTTFPEGSITGARLMNTYVYFARNCTSLTVIPDNLFDKSSENLLNNSAFAYAFTGTSITTVPTDLFKYAVNVSTNAFLNTFRECPYLETLPDYLFRYNVNADSWFGCFFNSPKVQNNPLLFCAVGEETTRFLNKNVSFRSCFSRTTFTGTQSTAPELWNYSFGTGTIDSLYCWYGSGNSTTSLTNYASIPAGWQ